MAKEVFLIPAEATLHHAEHGVGKSTLCQYVGDAENALAQRAVDAVFEASPAYNPVVLLGGTGTGKSLLLHGIANRWKAEQRGAKIILTTGADFARDFANVTDAEALADFRARYRRATLFLIDDLQEVGDRINAQNELIRTVDTLVALQHPFVATLSQTPTEMPLLPGLASRLSAGLTVPLLPPGVTAQRVILRRLVDSRGTTMSDSVIEWTVSALSQALGRPTTTPDLSRIVLQLEQHSRDLQQPIDEALVRDLLKSEPTPDTPPLRSITNQVSKYFKVRPTELKGSTRQQRIVRARGVAMFLARRLTGSSLDEVGRHFGNRDHTTVLHACRKTESLIDDDPSIRQAVQDLTAQLSRF